jgi:hypothetical protein
VAQKNAKLIIDEQSKEYWRWRDSILTYEETMLEMLTFDLVVVNPYQRLYEDLIKLGRVHDKELRDTAWTFCNDSCLTILPLLMDGRDLSISSIFFASSVTQKKIDDINGVAWWKALRGNEALMKKAIDLISDFYNENPLRKQGPHPGSPKFDLESTRRRGEPPFQSQNGTPMGTDGSTQSPIAPNSKIAGGAGEEDDEPRGGDETDSQGGRIRGDSDAALKAAANDLDVHKGKPNGRSIRSPPDNKRKLLGELDADPDGGRESKRARTTDPDEDEGEVKGDA